MTRLITLEEVKELAQSFLEVADEFNEQVSAYLNGSNKKEDEDAYWGVLEANRIFNVAYTTYWSEPMIQPHLDYELAESMLEDYE